MDLVVQALKEHKKYPELKKLWDEWDYELKNYLFLDLAIVHKNKDGVKLVADILGPSIYLTPYDEHERVTPLYIAQLLSRSDKDYEGLALYMYNRIEDSIPWNRRKSFLYVWRNDKQPKLPNGILNLLVLEFL
ncbi:hypothetical protein SteCoe_5415 [Stentor coeruleus]|uniref:Uncharacterized protein n=1 Tax=Stentor coeruleus TaxID=5963 RepID=A0A1R2CSM4_9CILI|nr:hypothetical protein SteCoe_5415 [Stentor coeruleus]